MLCDLYLNKDINRNYAAIARFLIILLIIHLLFKQQTGLDPLVFYLLELKSPRKKTDLYSNPLWPSYSTYMYLFHFFTCTKTYVQDSSLGIICNGKT